MPDLPAGRDGAIEPIRHAGGLYPQASGELPPRQPGKLDQPIQPLAEVLGAGIRAGTLLSLQFPFPTYPLLACLLIRLR